MVVEHERTVIGDVGYLYPLYRRLENVRVDGIESVTDSPEDAHRREPVVRCTSMVIAVGKGNSAHQSRALHDFQS